MINAATRMKNGLDLTPNNQFCNHIQLRILLFNFSATLLNHFSSQASDRLKDFKMARKDSRCEDSHTG